MFKKVITAPNFWRSVLTLALAFIVIFNVIRVLFQFGFSFSKYFTYYFHDGHLFSFIAGNLVGGFFYGFIFAYYRYWRYFKGKGRL